MCWRSASSRVEIEEAERQGGSGGQASGFQFGERDTQLFSGRKQDGAFDEVFEFADVAGPGIVRERVHGVGGNVFDVLVELAAESLNEVADKEGKIFGALAERGNLDGKDVQAVKEVTAKGALGDAL